MMSMAWCALGAAPLAAQSNNMTAPPPGSDIGPGELSNFSLNGTVTRPAEPPPAAQPQSQPQSQPQAQPPVATRTAPSTTATRPDAPRAAAPAPAQTLDPSGSDLFRRPPTLPDASAANAVTAAPAVLPLGQPTPGPTLASEGFSLLPWMIALLAVAGMTAMYFGRQRRQQQLSPAGNPAIDITRRDRPEPDAEPVGGPRPIPTPTSAPARTPMPAGVVARKPLPTTLMPRPPESRAPATAQTVFKPRPDPIVPGGIVSTGLRPWIDINLNPDRALLDEEGAAIAFEVTLFNSGSAAARDVIVEAMLLNAGASQDIELSEFFASPARPGDPIPQIEPYARIPLRSAVRVARANIREYAIEGRKLFVPLIALSVRYRWSSGEAQSAAGFLVGQAGEGKDKLAPFRLDRGPGSWKGLGVRRYEKGLRT